MPHQSFSIGGWDTGISNDPEKWKGPVIGGLLAAATGYGAHKLGQRNKIKKQKMNFLKNMHVQGNTPGEWEWDPSEIRQMQRYLVEEGYDIGESGVDAKWGSDTQKALDKWSTDVEDDWYLGKYLGRKKPDYMMSGKEYEDHYGYPPGDEWLFEEEEMLDPEYLAEFDEEEVIGPEVAKELAEEKYKNDIIQKQLDDAVDAETNPYPDYDSQKNSQNLLIDDEGKNYSELDPEVGSPRYKELEDDEEEYYDDNLEDVNEEILKKEHSDYYDEVYGDEDLEDEEYAQEGSGWYPGKRVVAGVSKIGGLLGGMKDRIADINLPGIKGTGFEDPVGRQKNWKQVYDPMKGVAGEYEWVDAPKQKGEFDTPVLSWLYNKMKGSGG